MIELVVIKLVRVGAGKGPDYTLKIYGNGTVLYEGRDNVKIIGDVKDSIAEEKVMELLTSFKESGFFSLEYDNIPSSVKDIPHTIISVSMPTESGETITKKLTYYDGDFEVPKELIMLGKKIEDIVDSKRWTSDYTKIDTIKQEEKIRSVKTKKHSKKKKSIEIFSILIILIVIACLFAFYIYPDFTSSPSTDETTPASNPYEDYYIEEGENIEIINLEIASFVWINESNLDPVEYDAATQFNIGDKVYVYYELKNYSILTNKTNNNQSCDLLLEITVENNSVIYHSDGRIRDNIGFGIEIPWFITNDDWPAGEYSIKIKMTDRVIDEITSQTIFFTLV